MNALTATNAPHSATKSSWTARADFLLWGAIFLALAGALALTWPRAMTVWTDGAFFDSDDAMRAVEVRDLLSGQAWFDMTAHRLDPRSGVFMHWSRVVDAPLAALELAFRVFLPQELAERATRLVFPFACLAALLALAAWNARILAGRAMQLPTVWATFLSGAMFLQFSPGRIDHHAPQIVLLVATLGFYNLGLERTKPHAMGLAAATMALSFAISLENLPFFLVLLAALPTLFILEGAGARRQLAWFALGVFIAFPLCFAATVAPSRYFVSACDAYSSVHLFAALAGALGLAALAGAATRLQTRRQRIFCASFAAAAALASVVLAAPQCLGDPLGGLDPLLRDLWLSHVVEAKPLTALADSTVILVTALPVVLGLVAALFSASRRDGTERKRWLVTAAAIGVGLVAGAWRVRAFSSVTPLAMAPLAYGAVLLARRLAAHYSPPLRRSLTALFCLAASPMGLALALPASGGGSPAPDLTCLKPRALAPLAALPVSKIVAPIDMGSHLLAHTPHAVFAAPYHRDNHGNRLAVDAFLAAPSDAERILRAAGADLVLWCASGKTAAALRERAPLGLASALARGDIPAWLVAAPVEATPYRVFALRAAE